MRENTLALKETRSKILFRAVDEFERLSGTNLAWFGLDELTYTAEEAWLRLEGRSGIRRRRGWAGSRCGHLKVMTGCTGNFIASPVEGYETVAGEAVSRTTSAGENSRLLRKAKKQLRPRFYRTGSSGVVSEHGRGAGLFAFERRHNVMDVEADPSGRFCGRSTSTWTRCLGDRADDGTAMSSRSTRS